MSLSAFFHPRSVVVLTLLLACPVPIAAQGEHQHAIDKAIHRGIQFLSAEIEKQQQGPHGWGQVALETYALIVAGKDIESDLIQNNLGYIQKQAKGSTHTYSLSCYVLALDAAIAQLESDRMLLKGGLPAGRDLSFVGTKYRPSLKSAVKTLVKTQNRLGAWHYEGPKPERREGGKTRVGGKPKPAEPVRFDNSNTQFAVLALGAGAKRRVSMSSKVWSAIANHFIGGQDKSGPPAKADVVFGPRARSGQTAVAGKGGTVAPPMQRGWHYTHSNAATWNMTCAGLSSLILARDQLGDSIDAAVRSKLDRAIRDGFAWTAGHWSPTKSLYGMYSLEKVADLGGVEKFGKHDWYRECSTFLIKTQQGNGAWNGGEAHGEKGNQRVATSFALLVLSRATRLLTMYTGVGAPKGEGRGWVVVPSLNAAVHYPTLLKALRTRPDHKYAKLLRGIVSNYPPNFRGELVPDLVLTRNAVGSKSIQKIIDARLAEITRVDYGDPQKYLEWYASWKKVNDIVTKKERKKWRDLLAIYKDPKGSPSLKQVAMWAFQRLRVRAAARLFVKDLADKDIELRTTAYNIIRSFFLDTPPPFDPAGPPAEREAQIEEIRAWVDLQRKKD